MCCFYDGEQLVILSRTAKTYRANRSKTRVDKNISTRRNKFMKDGRN